MLRVKVFTILKSYAMVFLITSCAFMFFEVRVVGQSISLPAKIDSPSVPNDVDIPSSFNDNPIQFFDDFSWRSFVALVWPAANGQRGQPDLNKTVGDSGPRVFETYKALHEVFHTNGSPPSAWNSFDGTNFNPAGIQEGWDTLTLASFSKFGDLGQAISRGVLGGGLVGPLISQNTNYVRYLTAFNKIEFDQIFNAKWYLRSNLPPAIQFPIGSIDVKSSWMIMSGNRHPERYYTRNAWLINPLTGKSFQAVVGLVGLHIVQKTTSRPQWIWSTFEQIDNVPPVQPNTDGAFGPGTCNFNNGSGQPQQLLNPVKLADVTTKPIPAPYNVERQIPIDNRTLATNKKYQNALKGTVWQYYQLVMTQWPIPPGDLPAQGPVPANQDGQPTNTFPGTVFPSTEFTNPAFANSTMETFDQRSIFKSCMACHDDTRTQTDFLWSLADHAFPANPRTPDFILKSESFRKLQDLLTH